MFGIGYILGFNIGRMCHSKIPSECGKIEIPDEVKNRQKRIVEYLKIHPYSSCGEIAKSLKEEHRIINGSLMAMLHRNQVYRTEINNQYKYFVY